MKSRVTMFVYNAVFNDNRVLKEAAALAAAGYAVTIVGLRHEGQANDERLPNGVRVVRLAARGGTRNAIRAVHDRTAQRIEGLPVPRLARRGAGLVNRVLLRAVNRAAWRVEPLVYLYDFDRAVEACPEDLRAEVWFAHDLNTLSTALRMREKHGGKVVYDSHEYWLDCNNTYTVFAKQVWAILERALIGKADRVVTVSPSIAKLLAQKYGVPEPALVLNTPPFHGALTIREPDSAAYGFPGKFVLAYVGLVTHQRGYEQIIDTLVGMPDVAVVCYGHGNPVYLEGLAKRAAERGVADRFKLAGSVPTERIQETIAAAHAGIITVQRGAISYDFALPSKLFEYVFSGLPVVSSDLIEIRNLVDAYELGVCIDERDAASIAEGIARLRAAYGKFQGPDFLARCRSLADRYAWGEHSKGLVALVDGLAGREAVR